MGTSATILLPQISRPAGSRPCLRALRVRLKFLCADALLRALGVEQLWMGGVSTNMCVETTAREAADRGYLVTLVEDGCATTHDDLHQGTMRNFQRLFGRVRSTGDSLRELGR